MRIGQWAKAKNLKQFDQNAYCVQDSFIAAEDCLHLLEHLQQLQGEFRLPRIERQMRGRNLDYRVMDGRFIQQRVPELSVLAEHIRSVINQLARFPVEPLHNVTAALNVNITDPGGEYRWHYDRNAITAILYLNPVVGGETELIPNSRWHLGKFKHTFLQRWLDQILINHIQQSASTRVKKIVPRAGRLVIMKGDRCVHSVRTVGQGPSRYNVVFTFDKHDTRFQVERDLDPYLYSLEQAPSTDPNYTR